MTILVSQGTIQGTQGTQGIQGIQGILKVLKVQQGETGGFYRVFKEHKVLKVYTGPGAQVILKVKKVLKVHKLLNFT